jgi:hypothetical protein
LIRRRPEHRVALAPPLRRYLETGACEVPDVDLWRLAAGPIRGNFVALTEAWAQYGGEILERWITQHAGSRPFGWGGVIAFEFRRVVRGPHSWLAPGRSPTGGGVISLARRASSRSARGVPRSHSSRRRWSICGGWIFFARVSARSWTRRPSSRWQ